MSPQTFISNKRLTNNCLDHTPFTSHKHKTPTFFKPHIRRSIHSQHKLFIMGKKVDDTYVVKRRFYVLLIAWHTPQGWRFYGYGVLQQIKIKNLLTSKEFNNKLKTSHLPIKSSLLAYLHKTWTLCSRNFFHNSGVGSGSSKGYLHGLDGPCGICMNLNS